MEKLPVIEIEGVKVTLGKYYCVGFAYKNNLLKAIILNPVGGVFPVDYFKIVIDKTKED